MDPTELARIELPAAPASIGRARRFVAEALAREVEAEVLHAALVITSELTTNAMLHARTVFEVVVRFDETGLRLEVHDGSSHLPRRKRYSERSGTGRGLILVESLASVAGAERTDAGKVVWAVLTEVPAEPPVVGSSRQLPVAPSVPLVAEPAAASTAEELQVAARDDEPDQHGWWPRDRGRPDLVLV